MAHGLHLQVKPWLTRLRFPIYEIWHQATRSDAAATAFMMILLVAALAAISAQQQTASRLTWSLARDDAIIGSKFIRKIHPTLGVPLWALLFNNVVVFIIGCIYLGSSTAFNAFIGTALILQQLSYAFPAALLMYRRRAPIVMSTSRQKRSFRLAGPFGWIANTFTVVFAVIVLVFYNFPVVLPATGSNMSKVIPFPHKLQTGVMLITASCRLYIRCAWRDGSIQCDQLVLICEEIIQQP